MNTECLKEEEFVQKIKDSWKPFDDSLNKLKPIQFHQNLKKVKNMIIQWSWEKKEKHNRTLREVEEILTSSLYKEGFVFLTETKKYNISQLENKIRQIILGREKEWHLKRREIYLQVVDDNKKFFHRFSNYRKNINYVWKIAKKDGLWAKTFLDIVVGVNYFQNLVKYYPRAIIDAIIFLTSFFPRIF